MYFEVSVDRENGCNDQINAFVWSETRDQYYLSTHNCSIWFDKEFKNELVATLTGQPMLEYTEEFTSCFGTETL